MTASMRRDVSRLAAMAASALLFACSDGGTGPKPAPQPSFIDIADATLTVAQRDTVRAQATVLDEQRRPLAGRTVRWSSADPAIASVTLDGLVRGVAAGTTTLTAHAGQISAEATVTVSDDLAVTIDPSDDLPPAARSRIVRYYTLSDSAAAGEPLYVPAGSSQLVLGVDAAGAPLVLAVARDSLLSIGARSTAATLVRLLFMVPGLPSFDQAALDAAIEAHAALPALADAVAARIAADGSLLDWPEVAALVGAVANPVANAILPNPPSATGPSGFLALPGLGAAVRLSDDGSSASHFRVENRSVIAFDARTTDARTLQSIDAALLPPASQGTTLEGVAGMVRIRVGQSDATLHANALRLGERIAAALLVLAVGDPLSDAATGWIEEAAQDAIDTGVRAQLQAGEANAVIDALFLEMAASEQPRLASLLASAGTAQGTATRFAALVNVGGHTAGGATFLRDHVDVFRDVRRYIARTDSIHVCQPNQVAQECIASVALAPDTLRLFPTDTARFTVQITGTAGTNLTGTRTLAWTSSDETVVTVAANGRLTITGGHAEAATVTATDPVTGVSATRRVEVVPSAAGTYELVSYRGVDVGEVCGLDCGWSIECDTCSMIIEGGEAVLTDTGWDFVIMARRANSSGGYNTPAPIYDSSGPLRFHARTAAPLNVPAQAWCTEPGLVSGHGYCSELPAGWVYGFRFATTYDPYMWLSDDLNTIVSGIGGQTVWQRSAP